MKNKQNVCMSALALVLASAVGAAAAEFQWSKTVINKDSKFESAGIADINQDGLPDIVCGEFWYEAPKWTSHKVAELVESDEYFNDFSNLPQDVDNDGDMDIISCAWHSQLIYWRENPGEGQEGLWKVHEIDKPGNVETQLLYDLNYDNEMDIVPNVANQVCWYEKVPGEAKWIKHEVGKEGTGHGVGVGDINGDGQDDIVCPNGWYEAAPEDNKIKWTWHEQKDFNMGAASVPILVYDVNEDGLQDIVFGLGHNFGVFWLEHREKDGERAFIRHEIDKAWSQPHYMVIEDVNGDGKWELISGKRYRAHNGNDPGEKEPLGIYMYNYNTLKDGWDKTVISEGGTEGFGLNPAIGDIDNDGDQDLICPGKSGLYLFKLLQ